MTGKNQNDSPRDLLLGSFHAALAAADPLKIVPQYLPKPPKGRTLFILDEPTTGLHFHDIDLLLSVLHRLRDHGNTVVVIEHNLDVIKTADWVVDLGPEGGDGGGSVIAQGTPEDVAHAPGSFTGRFLKAILEPPPRRRMAAG